MPVAKPSRQVSNDGQASWPFPTVSPRARTSECLRCGQTMFLPDWSGYLDRHRVQHLWECETCGYMFTTFQDWQQRRKVRGLLANDGRVGFNRDSSLQAHSAT